MYTYRMTDTAYSLLIIEDPSQQRLSPFITGEINTLCAHNDNQAIAALKKQAFDVILIDPAVINLSVFMPVLREELDFSPHLLPVIVLTHDNTPIGPAEAFEHGASDFVKSTDSQEILMKKILYWAGGADSFEESIQDLQTREVPHPLIDELQLSAFLEFIGLTRAREIQEEFKQDYEKRMSHISDPSMDIKVLGKELHAIASMSGNLGLKNFSYACRYFMNDLNEGRDHDRMSRLMDLHSLYELSIAALQEKLHS